MFGSKQIMSTLFVAKPAQKQVFPLIIISAIIYEINDASISNFGDRTWCQRARLWYSKQLCTVCMYLYWYRYIWACFEIYIQYISSCDKRTKRAKEAILIVFLVWSLKLLGRPAAGGGEARMGWKRSHPNQFTKMTWKIMNGERFKVAQHNLF